MNIVNGILVSVDDNDFWEDGTVIIPEEVEEIGQGLFKDNLNLKRIIINAELDTIRASVFDSCINLTSVKFKHPESLKCISSKAFNKCNSLKNFDFSALTKLRIIEFDAFSETDLEFVDFGNAGPFEIGKNAFSCCYNLKSVNLGYNLQKIKYNAFLACKRLSFVSIFSEDLSEIDASAFALCNSLNTFVCYSCPEIDKNAFELTKIETIKTKHSEYAYPDTPTSEFITSFLEENNT
jgi:hypothetical protein